MKYCLNTIVLNSKIKKPENALILCHGYGGNNKTMAIFANNWAKFLPNTMIFCPQGREKDFNNKDGYQWFDPGDLSKENITPKILETELYLNNFIDEIIQENSIDDKNIILGGFSQGCMISLQTGIKRIKKINSIIGYSGKIIDFDYMSENINSKPKIFLFHGSEDEIVDVRYHYETQKFLESKGFFIKSKIFEKCKHKMPQDGLNLGLKIIKQNFYNDEDE